MMRTLREYGLGKQTMEDHILEEMEFCSDYLAQLIKEVMMKAAANQLALFVLYRD